LEPKDKQSVSLLIENEQKHLQNIFTCNNFSLDHCSSPGWPQTQDSPASVPECWNYRHKPQIIIIFEKEYQTKDKLHGPKIIPKSLFNCQKCFYS
jgi:hypothetical protein